MTQTITEATIQTMAHHYSQDYLHTDIGPQISAGAAVFSALATIAVVLRLLARKISLTKVWWDDLFAVLGLVRAMTFAF